MSSDPFVPMHKHPPTPLFPAGMDPQYRKDIEAWLEDLQSLEDLKAKLLALAANLQHMSNPMVGVIEFMNLFSDFQGAEVSMLSDVDNLGSDIRNALSKAQDGVSGITGQTSAGSFQKITTPAEVKEEEKDAKHLLDFIKQLKSLLSFVKLHYPGMMDGGTIKELTDAIKGIKGAFGDDWNNPAKMAGDIRDWASSKDGQYNPALKTLLDNLQNINQSISAFSTTTNTQLQYKTEQIKQDLGVLQSSIDSLTKLLLAMVQNQNRS